MKKVKRILVVDDDPVQVRLLTKLLTDNGYVVISAVEAPDGLQKAINDSPDLIILDVMMPIINGFNFCKLLKSQVKEEKIPVIMVTARDELEDIKIGMEVGADAYMTKPVNSRELLRAIDVVEGIHYKETD